nr:metalloregulator ArsR/SmtB family transcription factor [Paraburkholderia tagetis]
MQSSASTAKKPNTPNKLLSAAPVFAALGDPARLRIVARLCESGPLSIVRLTEGADMTRQAVTKHLHALSDAGLVRSERSGRESLWRLDPRRLEEAQRYLGQISARWDQALVRLTALVESEGRDEA